MPEPWTLLTDDFATVPPEGLRAELVIYVGPGMWHHIVGTVRYVNHPGFSAPEGDWATPMAQLDHHDGEPGSASVTVLTPAADWPPPPDAGRAWQWWRPLPVATAPAPRGGR